MPVKLSEKKKAQRAKLLRSISLPKFPSFSKGTFSKISLASGQNLLEILEKCQNLDDESQTITTVDQQSSIEDRGNIENSEQRNVDKKLIKIAEQSLTYYSDFPQKMPINGVQAYGLLQKQVASRRSSQHKILKWSNRFMVLKESFLFYYSESERKDFENVKEFNIHPRGVIPIGGCRAEPWRDKDQKYGIIIGHDDFKLPVIIAAADEADQERWLSALQRASQLTLKNCHLGEIMIKELEDQGLRLHKEKQIYIDRLQSEAEALRAEIDRNEELERIKIELECERRKLECLAKELKYDLTKIKRELQYATEAKAELQTEKENLKSITHNLHDALMELEKEREKIMTSLSYQEREKQRLSCENTNLCKTTQTLKSELERIETETIELLHEKEFIETRLEENERKAMQLEEEKLYYSSRAEELMTSLNDVVAQKEMTEAELKEEMLARIAAERQLKAAEKALEHLEMALKLSGANITAMLKDQLMPHVRDLRKFFETCAEEAKLDANRPIIMKNAVYARKSFLRRWKNRFRSSFRLSTRISKHQTQPQATNLPKSANNSISYYGDSIDNLTQISFDNDEEDCKL